VARKQISAESYCSPRPPFLPSPRDVAVVLQQRKNRCPWSAKLKTPSATVALHIAVRNHNHTNLDVYRFRADVSLLCPSDSGRIMLRCSRSSSRICSRRRWDLRPRLARICEYAVVGESVWPAGIGGPFATSAFDQRISDQKAKRLQRVWPIRSKLCSTAKPEDLQSMPLVHRETVPNFRSRNPATLSPTGSKSRWQIARSRRPFISMPN